MNILLKFGIGANSSTFGLPHFATPCYEMGVFKTGVFKTGKIKTGFVENLGQYVDEKFLTALCALMLIALVRARGHLHARLR